jgi:hypothetical protein
MTRFNTYSTEREIADFIIRNIKKINMIFIVAYAATYINMVLMSSTGSLSPNARLLLFLPGVFLFIIGLLIYNRFNKALKVVGNIGFAENNMVLNMASKKLVLKPQEIKNITVVKKIKQYFSSEDYNYVLVNISSSDGCYKNLMVNKYSDSENNFEILKVLETYTKMNGVNYK